MTAKKVIGKIKEPELFTCLNVSTTHMTAEDDRLIKSGDNEAISYQYAEGSFVYVGEDNDAFAVFSWAFVQVINEARRLGCKFVNFDCDGKVYPELPKFSW